MCVERDMGYVKELLNSSGARELLNGSKRSRRAEPVIQPHLECVGQP